MSASGGVSIARSRGENPLYSPPPMRRQQQQQLQQQQQQQQQRPQKPLISMAYLVESGKRTESDECASSMLPNFSFSGQGVSNSTNLDRFLEHTTPVVSAQYLPKTSIREWKTRETEFHPYFVLGDLWESFKEWSAYGAGVPLLLNGSDSVVQYYVPFLSGIQLYIDPSRPSSRIRRPGEGSDAESSRETSSDVSSESGAERGANNVVQGAWNQQIIADSNIQMLKGLSLIDKPFVGSSSDENTVCNYPGKLIFEYLERDSPFCREPLADKISVLASRFPELRTYRSCDLSSSSWVSVAWYPIYRIPMGPTLQNLDACFLTFHSLSTPLQSMSSDGLHFRGSAVREVHNADMPFNLPLRTFALASYKFKISVWNHDGATECQERASILFQVADQWLRHLKVIHPDYMFFLSRNSPPRS